MKRAVRRSTALLVLVLALSLAATAQAAQFPRAAPEPASLLATAWSWIVLHVLPTPGPALTPISEKAGCDIDPNGRIHCVPVAPAHDAGCEIDPDGRMRCVPAAPMQIDAGCEIDPNGAQ